MYNRIKNVLFLIIFFIFIFLISKYYFSEQNIVFINQSRSSYETSLDNDKNNLPVLKNDTNNAIIYVSDLENFKNKRKKRFWEKLISNNNE
jgi:energy-coupling factor transporter transmembrane protein EcfT|tara:strand:+ start:276 stop:548 length:273 start_codon:yes stop_codon:yes gene_type:complete